MLAVERKYFFGAEGVDASPAHPVGLNMHFNVISAFENGSGGGGLAIKAVPYAWAF